MMTMEWIARNINKDKDGLLSSNASCKFPFTHVNALKDLHTHKPIACEALGLEAGVPLGFLGYPDSRCVA